MLKLQTIKPNPVPIFEKKKKEGKEVFNTFLNCPKSILRKIPGILILFVKMRTKDICVSISKYDYLKKKKKKE